MQRLERNIRISMNPMSFLTKALAVEMTMFREHCTKVNVQCIDILTSSAANPQRKSESDRSDEPRQKTGQRKLHRCIM